MYHKSAVKVEKAAASLRRVSIVFGVVAGFFFMASGLSIMANQVKSQKPSLKGTVDFTSMSETEDFVENLVQSQ